jgi:hypothetical protein
LERDISAENLVDIKQKVQDKYRWDLMTLQFFLMATGCNLINTWNLDHYFPTLSLEHL